LIIVAPDFIYQQSDINPGVANSSPLCSITIRITQQRRKHLTALL